jgi:hypothetical protein
VHSSEADLKARKPVLAAILSAGLIVGSSAFPQSSYVPPQFPKIFAEEGLPMKYVWDAEHEAAMEFVVQRLEMEGPLKVIEKTCEAHLKPVGKHRLAAAVLTYTLRWLKHKDATKIGKLVHRGASVLSQPEIYPPIRGAVAEIPNFYFPESFHIEGFAEFLATTSSPSRIPKVVLEANNSTNEETGENEFAPIASLSEVELLLKDGWLEIAKANGIRPGIIPLMLLPTGETVFTVQQNQSMGLQTCQVRLISGLSADELRMALERAPVERVRSEAIYHADGAHRTLKKDAPLLLFESADLKELK